MRWFKHQTNARRNRKLIALRDACDRRPLEAVGFYWSVLEIVAEEAKNEHAYVTLSCKRWARELEISQRTLHNYVTKCGESGLISFTRAGDMLTIEIPNLLKYRDEYSRKSGQSPDSLRTMSSVRARDREEVRRNMGNYLETYLIWFILFLQSVVVYSTRLLLKIY